MNTNLKELNPANRVSVVKMSKSSYEKAMQNIFDLRQEYKNNSAVLIILDMLEGAIEQTKELYNE